MVRNNSARQIVLCCLSIFLLGSCAANSAWALQNEKSYKATKAERKAATELLIKEKSEAFLVDWLKKHNEEKVVIDADGVGIEGNATRIKALLYESKESDGGFIVETEFQIKTPDGRTIIEFLAGTGETEDQAIADTILNFTLTTYHVAYKAFMNAEDPHQQTSEAMIGAKKRNVLHGDTMTRSNVEDPLAKFDLDAKLQGLLKDRELDGQTHWLKVVYGQHKGKVIAVSVTIDNKGDEELTKAVNELDWPQTSGFYLTKQFLIVESTK